MGNPNNFIVLTTAGEKSASVIINTDQIIYISPLARVGGASVYLPNHSFEVLESFEALQAALPVMKTLQK